MPFNQDWDKPLLEAFGTLRAKADDLARVLGEDNPVVKEMRDAVTKAEDAAEAKLTTLRAERDALGEKLGRLKGGKPTSPAKHTVFRTSPKALLPAAHTSLFARAAPWMAKVEAEPMANIRKGKRATNSKLEFDIFDFRWVDSMYTFPLQAQIRAYGLEQPVKDIAALYTDLIPKIKSFGVYPLEWCISSGVVAGDLMVMRDNLHLPECAKAAELMQDYLARFKAFLKAQTAKRYPGKPYWWYTQNFPHPLISYTLFLWVDYQVTKDEESLEGFKHIGAQLTGSFVYGKTKGGLELVNLPHRVHARQRDMQPSYSKTKGGSFDATYIETLVAAAIKHCWNGTGLIDERCLAALGHTVMLTSGPDGFSKFGKTASEALCGGVKVGAKSLDGQEVLILQGGKETVSTPGIIANRTTSRTDSVSQIRGAWGAATPFATQKNPEMAKLYHGYLDEACKQQVKAQGPALWRAFSEAQAERYLEGK